jgi:hypothetical protein
MVMGVGEARPLLVKVHRGGDMSDSSQTDRARVEKHEVAVRSQKQIVGHEEGNNPELEPLFANHFEMIRIGTDFYLDIGIVRPEEVIGLQSKLESSPPEVPTIIFHVLQRVAMSPDGFDRLRAGVESLASRPKGEKVAN